MTIRKLSTALSIIIVFYLTSQSSFLKTNISSLSSSFTNYCLFIVIVLLQSLNSYLSLKDKTSKKFLSLFILWWFLPLLFPYNINNLLNNLHIIVSYIAFIALNIMLYQVILRFNYQLTTHFYIMLSIIALGFCLFLSINSLLEIIFLGYFNYILLKI